MRGRGGGDCKPRRGPAPESSAASDADILNVFPPIMEGPASCDAEKRPCDGSMLRFAVLPASERSDREGAMTLPLYSTGTLGGRPMASRWGTAWPRTFVGTSGLLPSRLMGTSGVRAQQLKTGLLNLTAER